MDLQVKGLENMLAAALTDANRIQEDKRTRHMSQVITCIENAQDKVRRFKEAEL